MTITGISPEQERKMRIEAIKNTFLECKAKDLNINYNKFLWEIQQRYGSTERKAKEYLDLARHLSDGKLIDGEIIWN